MKTLISIMILVALTLSLGVGLSGCGQKLPDDWSWEKQDRYEGSPA